MPPRCDAPPAAEAQGVTQKRNTIVVLLMLGSEIVEQPACEELEMFPRIPR